MSLLLIVRLAVDAGRSAPRTRQPYRGDPADQRENGPSQARCSPCWLAALSQCAWPDARPPGSLRCRPHRVPSCPFAQEARSRTYLACFPFSPRRASESTLYTSAISGGCNFFIRACASAFGWGGSVIRARFFPFRVFRGRFPFSLSSSRNLCCFLESSLASR